MKIRSVVVAITIFLFLGSGLFAQEEGPDPSLVAVGSLSASNLYLSYLVLGTVADGFVGGSYDEEITRSIARETLFLNGNTRDALQILLDAEIIAPEEGSVLDEMIQSYVVLDNMAQALLNFIEDEADNGAAYQLFRVEAWDRISRLLNL